MKKLNLDTANETDIREELASPLLALLGYERGTSNDILREYTLSYGRIYLGRKKPNDPPLRGRPDYILSVAGAGRWILEVKAPSEEITQDVIEQAISYARHPEVSASYAVMLNGRFLTIFSNTQRSTDKPLANIEVTSLEELADKLKATLSPSAIRRDCSPPIVDLGLPLSEGFRSNAKITGGIINHKEFMWECNFPMPPQQAQELNKMKQFMTGRRETITGGRVWRDETSRIKARLDWAIPHEGMLQFVKDKQLQDAEYISLDRQVSVDEQKPTIFDVVGHVAVNREETLFDILHWTSKVAGMDMSMTYRGQAAGYIKDNTFLGTFQAEYESSFPAVPGLCITMFMLGDFEVRLTPEAII